MYIHIMKLIRICLIAFIPFAFTFSKAMQNNHIHSRNSVQDSIYRIWKFKKIEIPKSYGSGMGTIDKYDTWDLTKPGILSYTLADSGVFHTMPYKIINNAIVLQFPDKPNNTEDVHSKTSFVQLKTGNVQYKIEELTTTELKLIMHLTFDDKGKIHDFDLVQLDFEAKE
jgi:hypothetical protein